MDRELLVSGEVGKESYAYPSSGVYSGYLSE